MSAFSKFMKLLALAGGVRSQIDPVTGKIAGLISPDGSTVSLGGGGTMRWLNICNRGEGFAGNVGTSGPKLRVMARKQYTIRATASTIKVLFFNQSIGTGAESAGASGCVINGASIEVNGVNYPFKFNGLNGVSLPSGSVNTLTDALSVQVNKGDLVWIRVQMDTTTAFPGDGVTLTGDATYSYDPLNENNQIYGVGAISPPTGYSSMFAMNTGMIVGQVPQGTVAVIGVGDSIAQGFTDIGANLGQDGGGLFRRAAHLAELPYCACTITGKSLSGAVSSNPLMLALASYHTHCWSQLGSNDVGGATAAAMQANYISLWTQLKTAMVGAKHISQFKLIPRVTSTDGVTTTANQTPLTGFAANGVRDQLNFWFSQQWAAFNIGAVIDCSTCIEYPADPTKWALRTFATTLNSAYASGSTVSMNAVPRYGEAIVISPSSSPSTGWATASSFTGTAAPFTVTTQGNPGGPGAAGGAAVVATPSFEGTHPSGAVYRELMVPALLAQFAPR